MTHFPESVPSWTVFITSDWLVSAHFATQSWSPHFFQNVCFLPCLLCNWIFPCKKQNSVEHKLVFKYGGLVWWCTICAFFFFHCVSCTLWSHSQASLLAYGKVLTSSLEQTSFMLFIVHVSKGCRISNQYLLQHSLDLPRLRCCTYCLLVLYSCISFSGISMSAWSYPKWISFISPSCSTTAASPF